MTINALTSVSRNWHLKKTAYLSKQCHIISDISVNNLISQLNNEYNINALKRVRFVHFFPISTRITNQFLWHWTCGCGCACVCDCVFFCCCCLFIIIIYKKFYHVPAPLLNDRQKSELMFCLFFLYKPDIIYHNWNKVKMATVMKYSFIEKGDLLKS